MPPPDRSCRIATLTVVPGLLFGSGGAGGTAPPSPASGDTESSASPAAATDAAHVLASADALVQK